MSNLACIKGGIFRYLSPGSTLKTYWDLIYESLNRFLGVAIHARGKADSLIFVPLK